ncbi:MAG: response regulator, partial [Bacteroidota bacterium]
IKFTTEGSIDVHFAVIKKKNDEITLQGRVTDTGIGISPEKTKLIFQSFTQADDSVTRKYGGTGLGLTIVENLVKQMDGDINVVSPANPELGRGTMFTFTVKLKVPTQQVKDETKESTDKLTFGKPIHALVVDDNEINLLIARKVLQNFGARVTVADNGKNAISLAKENNFDIILMDIQMPDMDGYTTTMNLRKENFSNPIIALSANAFAEHVQQSLDSGMNGHIQKPFNPKQLFEVINKHLKSAA